MQEVSGTYPTDPDAVAQLASIDMALNQGLHSFLRKSFAPQIQMVAGRTETPDRCSFVRGSRAPLVNGFWSRAIERQAGALPVYDFGNMMIDCLCVCHRRFQNQMIGG